MGCSSSALDKAGDSSRFRSGVPSNENSSPGEQSKFCVAQPTPCTPGREAAFYGNSQRASHAPLEKPKASVVPTANGIKSCHQPSLANDEALQKDATDQSELAKTEPLVQDEASEIPQPGDKDDAPEMEEVKEGMETRTEAETEALGTEVRSQPPRTSGERDSPGAGEDTENPHTAGVTELLETGENAVSLETAKDLPPEEAMEKDAQPQLIEAIPKENSSPEVAEGSQSAEGSEEQLPQETPWKAEQPQLPETVLRENETPQMPDRSQLVQTPVTSESLCGSPDGTRHTHESQPEVTVGSRKQLAGTVETATVADMEMTREIHTDKAEQHIEGETGEKVEARMKNEKESEEAEAKEKETEAVDLGAAGDSGRGASAQSMS